MKVLVPGRRHLIDQKPMLCAVCVSTCFKALLVVVESFWAESYKRYHLILRYHWCFILVNMFESPEWWVISLPISDAFLG